LHWSALVTAPLLELKNVSKTFRRSRTESVVAVGSVSLHVASGETVALVGESGSGKSTLGRIALGLLAPDSGAVLVAGRPLQELPAAELRRVRAAMQPIFQDAAAALNPRRSAGGHLLQALAVAGVAKEADAIALLESVGLRPGQEYLHRLPHELSGGQRQRLTIARALAPRPSLIVADEPLSGADVSIRGQILNLLLDIRQQRAVAYLLITHDISVARAFADRVAVMMLGQIVETGPAERVLRQPEHAYTRGLLAAVPVLPRRRAATAGTQPQC
jgi:ABC-type oligopeptide transport system ATPase subunit